MKYKRRFVVQSLSESFGSQGLTLIECLVAIAVIGVTSAMIAPVMVFSMATRIQSQRAEQALHVAQGEVENVRLMLERGGNFSSALRAYPITSAASVAGTAAPLSFSTTLNSTTTNVAKTLNIDSDVEDEFAVQVFRSAGSTPTGSFVPVAFELGVRVYDIRAIQENSGSLQTDPVALSFTAGEGDRGVRPLAVIYTDFLKGDQEDALCEYWKYIDSTASVAGINDCT